MHDPKCLLRWFSIRHWILAACSLLLGIFGGFGCGGVDDEAAGLRPPARQGVDEPADQADAPEAAPEASETPTSPPTAAPADDPGPAPTKACGIPKGELTVRQSGKGSYVVYVPQSYKGAPTRLLVGLHGCGDSAWNFAEWAVNPYATRDGQDHIGISIDDASGGGNCWNLGADAAKVLAAIDDVAKCVYVHQQKVVVGGFSSGGMLAYKLGMEESSRFAGILISNSALSSAGNRDALIAKASWSIPVAHRAGTYDSVFPITKVRSDWAALKAAGFPLETSEVPGGHDGTTEDWANWLIPKMQGWKRP